LAGYLELPASGSQIWRTNRRSDGMVQAGSSLQHPAIPAIISIGHRLGRSGGRTSP